MAKKQRVSFLDPIRTAAVDYACPLCYKKMYGLTCPQHGTFVLCRDCGAAQTADHRCLANEPAYTVTSSKRKSVRTFDNKCAICGASITRGRFCTNDKKYQMRYYYNKKKGMSHEENIAKLRAQAKEQDRVNGMIETAEAMDISEVLG